MRESKTMTNEPTRPSTTSDRPRRGPAPFAMVVLGAVALATPVAVGDIGVDWSRGDREFADARDGLDAIWAAEIRHFQRSGRYADTVDDLVALDGLDPALVAPEARGRVTFRIESLSAEGFEGVADVLDGDLWIAELRVDERRRIRSVVIAGESP